MKTPQIAALPGMSPLGFTSPKDALRYHVSGAIERGEAVAIVEIPVPGPWHHTPGPWRIEQPKGHGTARFIWRNDEGPGFAGETNTNYRMVARDVHSEADARLIACAPDLLAELIAKEAWIVDYIPEDTTGRAAELASVRAAIAKAEGR